MSNIVAMVTLFGGKYNARNQRWVLIILAKFRLDMITLTVSKDRICLFV